MKKGFTFIELLVVISIIGLLAALLFPVFARVREKGRQTSCLSKERQIGLGVFLYVEDHDGMFFSNGTLMAGTGWAKKCYPYVRSAQLFRCPDDPNRVRQGQDGRYSFTAYPVSYGLNTNLCGGRGRPAATLPGFTAPARTVLLFEVANDASSLGWDSPRPRPGDWDDGSVAGNGNSGVTWHTPEDCPACVLDYEPLYATGDMGGRRVNGNVGSRARHGGGANYVAGDGHARWLRPEAVSSGNNALSPDARQRENSAGTGEGEYALTFSLR